MHELVGFGYILYHYFSDHGFEANDERARAYKAFTGILLESDVGITTIKCNDGSGVFDGCYLSGLHRINREWLDEHVQTMCF